MSNISNRHSFVAYVASGSGKTTAYAGQRLSVVRFKKDKNGNKAKDSQAVSIPVASLATEDYTVLATHITDWFKSVQDEIIREKCIGGSSDVSDEEISVSAVNAFLVAQSAGDRLTSEAIKEWFNAELNDPLLVAFADKLGIGDAPNEEQSKKLEQMCNVYRDKFGSLAGGRTMYDAATRDKLLKALSLIDCSEGIASKLNAKLTAMKEVNVEELLGL
jgi:hypothetical protein